MDGLVLLPSPFHSKVCVCVCMCSTWKRNRRKEEGKKEGKEGRKGYNRGHIPLGLALGEVDHACHGRGVRFFGCVP